MQLKNLYTIMGSCLMLVISLLISSVVQATSDPNPSSNYPVEVSASPLSLQADGVSASTVELFIFGYDCAGEDIPSEKRQCEDGSMATSKVALPNRWIGIYAYDSGLIFNNITSEAGVRYVTSDGNGRAVFQTASTIAGQKKLQFSDHVRGVPPINAATQELIFTDSQPSEVDNSLPAAPILKKVTIDGTVFDPTNVVSITSDQVVTLSGAAAPNSKVTLSINAKIARTEIIYANEKGEWSHELIGLTEGNYTITSFATTPSDGDTSPEVSLLSFEVAASNAETSSSSDETEGQQSETTSINWLMVTAASFAAVLLIASILWYILRSRRNK